MKQFFVLRSLFLVCVWQFVAQSWLLALVGFLFVHAPALSEEPGTKNQEQRTEVFRPEPGKFPPLEKAHAYRGELVFVDHANRRGSIRVAGTGKFYRNDPQPFAMLPYGVIRYQGAPADLRDIPLGTVMHVRAFLPPDPKLSTVPVLPVNNKEKDAGHYRGTGIRRTETAWPAATLLVEPGATIKSLHLTQATVFNHTPGPLDLLVNRGTIENLSVNQVHLEASAGLARGSVIRNSGKIHKKDLQQVSVVNATTEATEEAAK